MGVLARIPSRTDSEAKILLQKAEELIPFLRAKAPETEQARWIGDEISRRMIEDGLYDLTRPRRYGGAELSIQDQANIIAKIGEGCMATAWVAALHNLSGWILGTAPKALQDEIFNGGERAILSGIINPSGTLRQVDGGYVLNGKWPFASGCRDATWMLLSSTNMDEAGASRGRLSAIVPLSDLVINDDWNTMALAGTGSNSVSAVDVFVPERRTYNPGLAVMGIVLSEFAVDEPLYRSALMLATGVPLVAPVLGAARAMLEAFLVQVSSRALPYTTLKTLSEWSHTQSQVARAHCLIAEAEFNLMECAVETDRAAENSAIMDIPSRARARAQMARCMDLCRDAANILMGLAGGSAISVSNPIQRHFRDIHGANSHALLNPAVSYEVFGEALLGQPFMSLAI
jgi:3-hydroxy-9,10-secoandrosta-1,3,5(10)-triene-9,17-dione monooxygenase